MSTVPAVTIDVIEDVIENKLKPAMLAAFANGTGMNILVESGDDESVKDGTVVHTRNGAMRFTFEIDPEKLMQTDVSRLRATIREAAQEIVDSMDKVGRPEITAHGGETVQPVPPAQVMGAVLMGAHDYGFLVRRARMGIEVSLGDLARKANLSVVQVSALERGETTDYAKEILDALGALARERTKPLLSATDHSLLSCEDEE